MRNRFINARKGFSLVEVMIAMGVVAIGLIAIIGLIPQGIRASRSAADNTLSATIVHDVLDAVRVSPFTSVDLSKYGFTFTPPGPYDLRSFNAPISAFFDSSGLTPATPQDNYYKVVLKFQPQGTLPLSLVTATVSWPAKSASPLNNITNFTQIANYQQ